MPCQEEPQAVLVTVLSTEVGRRVPINVLRIKVGPSHEQCLDHTKVSSDARYVQGCSKILSAWIEQRAVFNKDFHQLNVALTGSHMKRSPSIRVRAIDADLCLTLRLRLEYLEAADFIAHLHR